MQKSRPYVLSIAGFDPSGGAGVLADIKTLEQLQVQGIGLLTANTIQTEAVFMTVEWVAIDKVLDGLRCLLAAYPITVVKIGIVPGLGYLEAIIDEIKCFSPSVLIIWDPVISSSTGFFFIQIRELMSLKRVLKKINILTPNYKEMELLIPGKNSAEANAVSLSYYCGVLLKGGHRSDNVGVDQLYLNGNLLTEIKPEEERVFEKHGSGCILSSAIAAWLARGENMVNACIRAKRYTAIFLSSTKELLGYHYVE